MSRKVLSLTKPKGKIYKAKSFSHYITLCFSKKFNLAWVICLHSIKMSNSSIWPTESVTWYSCYIARYTDMWNRHNVHKIFINIYRNPKTQNWFRYETFIHFFEFKGFSTWGERDTIFLCWLLLHRQLSRAAPVAHKVVWPCPCLNLNSLVRRQELNSLLFLKSPKSSAHASGAWRHSHPLVSIPPEIFILTSLNDTSSPRAREHLRSCLHLTNPCTEPKGSRPN